MRTDLEEESDLSVDMAPLIDCVFLLLIFFLVATTMKKIEKELPLDLPEAAAAIDAPKSEEMVILGVDATGQTYWGTEPIAPGALRERLQQLAAQNPGQRIRIDADRRSPYENVLHVIDACSFYGLKNLGLHTRQERGSR